MHDANPVDLMNASKSLAIEPNGPLCLHYRLLGMEYHAAKNRAQMTRAHRVNLPVSPPRLAPILQAMVQSLAGVKIDEATAKTLFPDISTLESDALHWYPDGKSRSLETQDRELFERVFADAVDVTLVSTHHDVTL
jgi:hypothetical protein